MEGGDSRRGDDAAGDNGIPTRSVVEITRATPWLWRMVDRPGVLDVLAQSRRDKSAAKRLLPKLLKQQYRVPGVMITDKLGGESVAQQEPMPGIEHRRHKGSAIGPYAVAIPDHPGAVDRAPGHRWRSLARPRCRCGVRIRSRPPIVLLAALDGCRHVFDAVTVFGSGRGRRLRSCAQ